MKIALDARYTVRSGASTYIRELVPRLLAQAPSSWRFVILKYEGQPTEGWGDEVTCIDVPRLSAAREMIWMHTTLPRLLKREGVNLYHGLKLFGPLNLPCPSVHTAHAITKPYQGDEFPLSPPVWFYFSVYGSWLYRRSHRVIAVSGHVADFLYDRLGVERERIRVIHNGLDERFRTAAPMAMEAGQTPYVLCVGNMFPVKNQITAWRAFASIASRVPHMLMIAGDDRTPVAQQIRQEAAQQGLSDRVRLLGFANIDWLIELYSRASVLVHPSLTEGCPITVIEAMSRGAPIVASSRGGLREILEGVAILIDDPTDVEAFAQAMLQVLTDPARQSAMRQASLRRSQDFDWSRHAQQTLEVYAECQDGPVDPIQPRTRQPSAPLVRTGKAA